MVFLRPSVKLNKFQRYFFKLKETLIFSEPFGCPIHFQRDLLHKIDGDFYLRCVTRTVIGDRLQKLFSTCVHFSTRRKKLNITRNIIQSNIGRGTTLQLLPANGWFNLPSIFRKEMVKPLRQDLLK